MPTSGAGDARGTQNRMTAAQVIPADEILESQILNSGPADPYVVRKPLKHKVPLRDAIPDLRPARTEQEAPNRLNEKEPWIERKPEAQYRDQGQTVRRPEPLPLPPPRVKSPPTLPEAPRATQQQQRSTTDGRPTTPDRGTREINPPFIAPPVPVPTANGKVPRKITEADVTRVQSAFLKGALSNFFNNWIASSLSQLTLIYPSLSLLPNLINHIKEINQEKSDDSDDDLDKAASSLNPIEEALNNFQLAEDRSGKAIELLRVGKVDEAEEMARKAGSAYFRHLNALHNIAGVVTGGVGIAKVIKAATKGKVTFLGAILGKKKSNYESDTALEGLADELGLNEKDSELPHRLETVREGDVGGYRTLSSKGLGKKGDGLASHEIAQHAKVTGGHGAERIPENPSVAVATSKHVKETSKLHVGDVNSMSMEQIIDHNIDALKDYFPEYLLKELRKEAEKFAKLNF